MAGLRLKGQEVSIRIVQDGGEVDTIDSIGSFNDEVSLEVKEDGFLGEPTNRFDQVLNGYGGDFEMQATKSGYLRLIAAIEDKATRRNPGTVFNVVRTDLYPDGSSAIFTFRDVVWGAIPSSVGGRGDFVKWRMNFKCSERATQTDGI